MDARIATAAFTLAMAFAGTSVAASVDHYYEFHEGHKYGYGALGSSELTMVRYLGERGGVHKVVLTADDAAVVFACEIPCKHMKANQYQGSTYQGQKVIKVEEGSIGWEVFKDIEAGNLDRVLAGSNRMLWSEPGKGLQLVELD
ncbi:hypothetical protein FAZ79_00460 [Guyparkeria sp. SB14A]|uniref:hypothetical protein n=1 Tax=Guyparkeria sp. SB14A TaxID=2571147 RepID=UPI0010AC1DE2|nr:hypothetical protein [Guyparkeria sp. SB14A]TKA91811.1 hypothetical protein FAZ79_00460 [Guyparkeria sp. SB14A]